MAKYDFHVQVQPEYLPEESSPSAGVFCFAYRVSVTNRGEVAAQLVARRWIVSDANGHTEEVRGLGVVGQQPVFEPGETFDYTSGCRLRTASGTMHGNYLCVSVDGQPFDCPISLFVLEATEGDADEQTPLAPRVLH